jgi:hypothetical protein
MKWSTDTTSCIVKDPLLQGYISKAYRIIHIAIRGYWQHETGKKWATSLPICGNRLTHQELSKNSQFGAFGTVVRININCQEIFLGKQTFGENKK